MKRKDHNGKCESCGKVIPCLESDCDEPEGHDYICEDCLNKYMRSPHRSYLDALDPVTRFGY